MVHVCVSGAYVQTRTYFVLMLTSSSDRALAKVRASANVRARAPVRVQRAHACVRCVRAGDRLPCPSATVFGQSSDASRDRHLVLAAGSPRLGPSAESCMDPLPTGGPDLL
jgi:hypothetical protein